MEDSHSPSSMEEKAPKMPMSDELDASDPRLAMNWPYSRKIMASIVAFFYTFTLLFSLTGFAAAVPPFIKEFNVSMEHAFLGFSLFLFGIMFAPTFTPHVSERVGRQPVYFGATVIMSAFLLGAAFSRSYVAFVVCRFFAGFFGGPIVVNVEGSFADLWDARYTVTYYSFLAAAQYMGASVGPIICAGVVAEENWRWTQYIPLMAALAALLLGLGASETYPRQIARNAASAAGRRAQLSPALSGATFATAMKLTIWNPIVMLISEPIVGMSALTVGVNFAALFSLFTTVPTVLTMLYNLTPHVLGLGFLAGLAGSAMAVISSVAMEPLARSLHTRVFGKMKHGLVTVEYRLAPAIFGSLLMIAGLFWIGNTASPEFKPIVPIAGTAFFVWGSMSVIIGVVGYFFDAYPDPPNILSALTAMAVFRLFCAGIVSIFFLTGVMAITGKWMFQIFGIIQIVLTLWLIVLGAFGPELRSRSRFVRHGGKTMSPLTEEAMADQSA